MTWPAASGTRRPPPTLQPRDHDDGRPLGQLDDEPERPGSIVVRLPDGRNLDRRSPRHEGPDRANKSTFEGGDGRGRQTSFQPTVEAASPLGEGAPGTLRMSNLGRIRLASSGRRPLHGVLHRPGGPY